MALVSLYEFLDAPGATQAQDSAGTAQDATFSGDSSSDGSGTASFDGDGDYLTIDPNAAHGLTQGTVEMTFIHNSPSPGDVPFGSTPAHTLFSSDASGHVEGHLTIWIDSTGELNIRHQIDGGELAL